MKNNNLFPIFVLSMMLIVAVSGAYAGDSPVVNAQSKADATGDDNFLKLDRTEVSLSKGFLQDVKAAQKNIDIKKEVVKSDASKRQSVSTAQGPSIAHAALANVDQAKVTGKTAPTARWRKKTVNAPAIDALSVKNKNSKELNNLEKQRKDRKKLLKKQLGAVPSRGTSDVKDEESRDSKSKLNGVDNAK